MHYFILSLQIGKNSSFPRMCVHTVSNCYLFLFLYTVSYSWRNILSQISWLKPAQFYYLTVLEARSLKTGLWGLKNQSVGRFVFLLEGLGKFSSFFFPASRGCPHSLATTFIYVASAPSLTLTLLLSLHKGLVITLGPPGESRIIFPSQRP